MPANPPAVNGLFGLDAIFVEIPPPGRSYVIEGPAAPLSAGLLDIPSG
jgi:hypothetical protein